MKLPAGILITGLVSHVTDFVEYRGDGVALQIPIMILRRAPRSCSDYTIQITNSNNGDDASVMQLCITGAIAMAALGR